MSLHPVILEKLHAALTAATPAQLTRRDAGLPAAPGKVHAVTGMRRAGKTTFLRQLQAERRRELPPERAVFMSFDDDRLADLELNQLGQMLDEYYRLYPQLRGRETVYWFLDEIQLVPGWERFVRRVMDNERVEFVVSGSSARMLSREVHTSLRGRGMATIIRPFSFREFLRHRGEEEQVETTLWTKELRSLIENRFREYLVQGGFPEAQGLEHQLRVELLQGYVDTVLFRDVVERYGISQVAALRWMTRHCLRNPAATFSVHRLYQDLKAQGHGVAKDAVHALLGHLLDAFLISTVSIATDSERRRNSNPRKVYPVDPGLIGAFDTSGRTNLGHALETVVQNELERRKGELSYVKLDGGYEVDFYCRSLTGEESLIQVCVDAGKIEIAQRELRALEAAGKQYPKANRLLLTLTQDVAPVTAPSEVLIQPVYEWMLIPGANGMNKVKKHHGHN